MRVSACLLFGSWFTLVGGLFGATTFETVDLAPLKKQGAFGDAVWKDALREKSDFTFYGVPFKLMKCENTADPTFSLELKPDTYAEAAVLFCIDEANPRALPFVTVRYVATGVVGETVIDLRSGALEGPTAAPEIGRILRGPSGKLHFPVRFARIPLHPAPVSAAEKPGRQALEFIAPAQGSSFTIAALTLVKKPPMKDLKNGVTLSFDVDLSQVKDGDTLYESEGALKLYVRDAKKNPAPGGYDDNYGNYYNFSLPDGSCPVIEAFTPGATPRVGIPFGALKNPNGVNHVQLVHNANYFILDVGERRDEEFPWVPILWPQGDEGLVKSAAVKNFKFSFSAPTGVVPRPSPLTSHLSPLTSFNPMYWNPADHNRWLGDIVTTTWNDTLHVFYLADRRHHNSKGGRGGHYFEHIASDDLAHWRELPTAVPQDVPTEYIGTGTPFIMDGKYCLAYGLHTTRHCDAETVKRLGLPFGGTYSVSDDGIHFRKTGKVFTSDQNPSVYNRPDGWLGMGCCDHLEKAKTIDGPWEKTVENTSAMGDCPCPFEWNGWHYIIQGFATMAMSPSGKNGTYTDEVLAGYDVYEGLSVPMVAEWKGNRRLLIGWINHRYGWGGWLCLRELVQYPDGHLGTKWIPEIQMPVEPTVYKVNPGETLTLEFATDDRVRGRDFAFVLDSKAGTARFVEKDDKGGYPDIPSLKDIAERAAAQKLKWRLHAGRQYRPDEAGDFKIINLRGLDKPFEVRVENYFQKKSGMTLLDVEIAGQRTMVTRRWGRHTEIRK